jgi:hypothetical protein
VRGGLNAPASGPIDARVPSVRPAGPNVGSRLRKAGMASREGLGPYTERVPSRLIAFQRTPLLRIRIGREWVGYRIKEWLQCRGLGKEEE